MTSCGHLEEPTVFPLGFGPEGEKAPFKDHHPKVPHGDIFPDPLLIGPLGTFPLATQSMVLGPAGLTAKYILQPLQSQNQHFNKSPGDWCTR